MKIFLFPTVIVLLWVLSHNIRKSHSTTAEVVSSYLRREDNANAVRRKDLTNLPYIEVPLDTFPFDITLNDEKKQLKIQEYEKEIRHLAELRMLNLIGMSNTELKESYGPANLEPLSIYDQTYSRYIRTLHFLAECIYDEYPDRAVSLLEYCISIGTDISGTYDLLGRYYLEHQDEEKFAGLYDKIPVKDSISGKTIQKKLDQMKTGDEKFI